MPQRVKYTATIFGAMTLAQPSFSPDSKRGLQVHASPWSTDHATSARWPLADERITSPHHTVPGFFFFLSDSTTVRRVRRTSLLFRRAATQGGKLEHCIKHSRLRKRKTCFYMLPRKRKAPLHTAKAYELRKPHKRHQKHYENHEVTRP